MQLSKRTQYGIRAMICLCDAYPRGYIQTRELAARENLPTKFLESILSALARGKVLSSKIGAMGGYRLARPPKDIPLGDIISRLEGKMLWREETPLRVEELQPGEVAVHLLHARLSEALVRALAQTTLASLAEQVAQRTHGGQMYYI